MMLHGLLARWLPPRLATLVTLAVYALLIVMILILAPTPPMDFRYARY